MVNVAWSLPLTPFKIPLPSGVDPSKKVTMPVGVPLAVVTVAVNVTVSPSVLVAEERARVVVVAVAGGCAPADRPPLPGRADA